MTTTTKGAIANAGRWKKLWQRLRAIDDAFDHDDTKRLRASLKHLDERLSRLEVRQQHH